EWTRTCGRCKAAARPAQETQFLRIAMHASDAATTKSMPDPTSGEPLLPKLANVPAFTDYMATGWGTPDRTPPVVAGAAAAAAAHRARLSAEFPGQALIVGAGTAPVRANDTYYDFRPDSDFYWLTGASIEAAVLVMAPTGAGHDATLYIPTPFYPGDPQFFANAAHGEMWVGAAPDFSDWSEALSLPVKPLSELDAGAAAAMRAGAGALGAGVLGADLRNRHGIPAAGDLGRVLATLRMVKDDWEIAQLREAVDHTIDGFAAVVKEIPQAV